MHITQYIHFELNSLCVLSKIVSFFLFFFSWIKKWRKPWNGAKTVLLSANNILEWITYLSSFPFKYNGWYSIIDGMLGLNPVSKQPSYSPIRNYIINIEHFRMCPSKLSSLFNIMKLLAICKMKWLVVHFCDVNVLQSLA